MEFKFYKYQGTGNDFVMIDNRDLFFPKDNVVLINTICDRKFGVGADGLILLENDDLTDFRMVYYNADGNESTMCGNGGRCIVQFAYDLQLISKETTFIAVDGLHEAEVNEATISLQMINVDSITAHEDGSVFMNTGSPHHVAFVENIDAFPIFDFGKNIRYSAQYAPGGTNVNVVEPISETSYKVRTYERGVEDETLSCGTGATAVALAMHYLGKATSTDLDIHVPGGQLKVSFKPTSGGYENVFLIGPAQFVFEGVWKI
jgi:diaminopimelate epimerase